jgi:putative spermidine/putrescine transport system permease protein/spermidine/putrescine transport system permease protein
MSEAALRSAPRLAWPFSQSDLFRWLHAALVGVIVLFIAVPVAVTMVMSFNDASLIRFPIRAWSLRWYFDFFNSSQWTQALLNSLEIAAYTTLVSTVFGTIAAYAFTRLIFPLKGAFYFLVMLPLFMPGIVLGLGIAIAFGGVELFGIQLYGGKALVVVAHCLWAMPLTFMVMEATFKTFDERLVEAAYDLGGGPVRTFLEVTLPMVSTGVISGALFSFVISLNEFVMALFLTTRDTQTLPVLMWLSLRSAGTPRLAVAAVVLAAAVFLSLVLVMLWYARHVRKLR